ncbi:MAG: oligosaccharide flippase family protein [Candidatus Eisenbacteria bacterium]|nr:oligosaccharide flippase family protein [Candidatus Eisenbacteria bacterium]
MSASPNHAAVDTAREVPGAMLWSLVGRVLVTILAIGSNIMIVRGLGKDLYGVYSIYLNIAHFVSLVIGIGTAQAILRFLPELRVQQDARGSRSLLWRATGFHFVSWIVLVGLALLLRGPIGDLQHADLHTILPLGVGLLIGETIWGLVVNVYTALRRMVWLAVASVAQKLALIGLLLLLMRSETPAAGASRLDVPGVLWVVAASFALGLLLLLPGMPRILPGRKNASQMEPVDATAPPVSRQVPTRRLLAYAIPVAVTGLISQIVWRSSETLIIGHYHPPDVVGFYNAAYNLAQMALEFVPLAVWPVILGGLTEVHARKQEHLARGLQLYFRLIFILVLPVAITGAIFGGQLYRVMYGTQMNPGIPVCQALFLVLVLGFFGAPLRMGLFVRERNRANLLLAGAGALVNVALDLLLIPRYGMWGGVAASGTALLVSAILQYAYTVRIVPGLRVPWFLLVKVFVGSLVILPLWLWRERFDRPLEVIAAFAGSTLVQFLVLRLLRVFGSDESEILLRSNIPMKRQLVRLLGGDTRP